MDAYKILLLAMMLNVSLICNAQNRGIGATNYRVEKCTIGQQAPEVYATNEDDIEFTLSSLQGKMVLVQFWTSECRPCQADNQILSKIYDNYKDKNYIYGVGFEIYSISLDLDSKKWRDAIINQKISSWIHVCEHTGVNSAAAKKFNVSAIPANFLIDGHGKIIAKAFRASELPDMLTNYLE
mgnify:FL=1